MKLHLASANAHKVGEFQELARVSRIAVEIVSARAMGGMPAVSEDTGTFAGNARKKAAALRARLPEPGWVLADDSGLCVEELGGAPGVESAYFAGPAGDPVANLRKVVEALREVPEDRRAAYFICVLVLLNPEGEERLFEGRCGGRLVREPRGSAGFGYDPLFVPEGEHRTLAEMEPDAKNALSHRGRAWAQLAAWWRAQRPSSS